MVDSSDTIKWKSPRSILVTFLGAVAIEIFVVLYASVSDYQEDLPHFIPWTFHTFWEIAALLGIAYVVRKYGIGLETYSVALVLGALFVSVIWIFIPGELRLLKANYYEVESR